MAEVEIRFDDAQFRKFYSAIESKLKKVDKADKDFLAVMSAIVFKDVIDHFDKEEGSEGPWAAWSDVYAEHMDSIGKGGNKVLQDTGHLRQNFKPNNVRKVPGGLLWYNNAKTSSGFPYAAAHDIGGKRLPQRDFMWLSSHAQDVIAKAMLAYILDE